MFGRQSQISTDIGDSFVAISHPQHTANFFSARFAVEPSNGTIRTTGLLDYEKSPEYTFALLAKDGGGFYERRNATTIKIVLEDENDNAPVFDGLPYSAKILEGAKNGTSVFQVGALRGSLGCYA